MQNASHFACYLPHRLAVVGRFAATVCACVMSLPAGAAIYAGSQSVTVSSSGGAAIAFPDVCKTPLPTSAPIAIPYPGTSLTTKSGTSSKTAIVATKPTTTTDSSHSTSMSDETGSGSGIVANRIKGKAQFQRWSFDVKVEGKSVARAFDLMLHNDKNTPPFPVLQGPDGLAYVNQNPGQVSVGVSDSQGETTPLTESTVIELNDGTVCIVCMQRGRLTKILRVRGEVTRAVTTTRAVTPRATRPASVP